MPSRTATARNATQKASTAPLRPPHLPIRNPPPSQLCAAKSNESSTILQVIRQTTCKNGPPPSRLESRSAPTTSLKVPKAFRPTSERKVGMLSMPAFLPFYPVFCGVFDFVVVGGVLRFFAAKITRSTSGLWVCGVLGRFLCFFVSLSVRVKSRPTRPDGPDTERIDSANRWVFDAFSLEGAAIRPSAEISPQRNREKSGNVK